MVKSEKNGQQLTRANKLKASTGKKPMADSRGMEGPEGA